MTTRHLTEVLFIQVLILVIVDYGGSYIYVFCDNIITFVLILVIVDYGGSNAQERKVDGRTRLVLILVIVDYGGSRVL